MKRLLIASLGILLLTGCGSSAAKEPGAAAAAEPAETAEAAPEAAAAETQPESEAGKNQLVIEVTDDNINDLLAVAPVYMEAKKTEHGETVNDCVYFYTKSLKYDEGYIVVDSKDLVWTVYRNDKEEFSGTGFPFYGCATPFKTVDEATAKLSFYFRGSGKIVYEPLADHPEYTYSFEDQSRFFNGKDHFAESYFPY
ncbi:MAG: hypothetical protein IJ120_11165 [Solobacterium sp.]|nr:hypothetical protein [Solobacterium sp.]